LRSKLDCLSSATTINKFKKQRILHHTKWYWNLSSTSVKPKTTLPITYSRNIRQKLYDDTHIYQPNFKSKTVFNIVDYCVVAWFSLAASVHRKTN
jgi:hypothetical protein